MNKTVNYFFYKVIFIEGSQEFRVADVPSERQILQSEVYEEEKYALPFLTLSNKVVMLTKVKLKDDEVLLVDFQSENK